MDQRISHLSSDRIALLMAAAKATSAYVKANPELDPEVYTQEPGTQPLPVYESPK